MKAIVQAAYGAPREVLALRDVPVPTPGPDEVRVRVHAASVHADVWHVVTGQPRVLRLMGSGLRKPRLQVPGTDLAGVVEAVGEGVTRFRIGDAVLGECVRGMQWVNGGAYAELAVAPVDSLALKAASTPFDVAATVGTAGFITVNTLRGAAAIQPGMRVLMNGAAGAVGSIALQWARAHDAVVTAVDRAETLPFMSALGANRVVDYAVTDVTAEDARYDLIFDIASTLSYARCKRVLADGGHYIALGHDAYGRRGRATFGSMPQIFALLARSLFDPRLPRLDTSLVDKRTAMAELAGLLERGALTPRIARAFPLAEAASALELLASGTAVGRIVLVP